MTKVVYEEYKDQAALDYYNKSEHFFPVMGRML
jgi:quinol monooxygenase YgiN